MILRSITILFILIITAASATTNTPMIDITKTVIKKPIVQGVSVDEAIDSMKLRANELNIKFVAHQPLSKEYQALGLPNIKRTEIFQFCDAKIAKEMIEYDMSYAAYMPCRIILVEDQQGQHWFVMMNLDIFIQSAQLPPRLHKLATQVHHHLLEIIEAGAQGAL